MKGISYLLPLLTVNCQPLIAVYSIKKLEMRYGIAPTIIPVAILKLSLL